MGEFSETGGYGFSRRAFLERLGGVGGTALLMAGMSALGFGIESAMAQPPALTGGGKGKKVLVLGTGVAGLTSAYELSNAGYNVTVLEARDRFGGRSWTARKGTKLTEVGGETETCDFEEGYYINPGPWRIPYFHKGYLHYAKKFGVGVELFNNDNDQSPILYEKGSGALAGKPIKKVEVAADMRGYAAEMLAKQVRGGALDGEFGPGDKELFLDYLRTEGYLTRNDFKYIGAEGREPLVLPGAGMDPGEGKPSKPFALTDILQSGTWKVMRSISNLDQQRTMFQPIGGMHELPKGFVRNLKVNIKLQHEVKSITQDANSITVKYLDTKTGQTGSETADYVMCCIPLSILRTMDIQVSPQFKEAIGGVSYALVGKIGIQMKERFWEDKHRMYGGHLYVDDPLINTISMPSTGWLGEKGVVLGFYPHGAAAAKLSAMSLADRKAYALKAGAKIFPEYADMAEGSFSMFWHRAPYNLGGWAEWTEDGRKKYYPTLLEPQGRLILAGEHLSYLTGWQEGGIESAWQQMQKLHALAQVA
jgi:monoamine oxidase